MKNYILCVFALLALVSTQANAARLLDTVYNVINKQQEKSESQKEIVEFMVSSFVNFFVESLREKDLASKEKVRISLENLEKSGKTTCLKNENNEIENLKMKISFDYCYNLTSELSVAEDVGKAFVVLFIEISKDVSGIIDGLTACSTKPPVQQLYCLMKVAEEVAEDIQEEQPKVEEWLASATSTSRLITLDIIECFKSSVELESRVQSLSDRVQECEKAL